MGMPIRTRRTGISYFEPEALALISAMTVKPDVARQTLINATIKALKKSGVWEQLDVLYITAGHDRQASKLNWKNPSLYTITEINSPTFTVDRGFNGDGATSYLNSNFNANTNGVKYTLNSASSGLYCLTNSAAGTFFEMGATSSGIGTVIGMRIGGNGVQCNINAGNTGSSSTNSAGFQMVKRRASNSVDRYKNGVKVGTTSSLNSSSVASRNIYICASNGSGVATSFSARQIGCVFLGSGIVDHSALWNIVQTYMTGVGANV